MDKVTIYSTPTCVFCTAAKSFFQDNKIAFEEHDVASDLERRREMIEKSGQMGVPVITIGKEVIVGFDEPRLAELLVN
ncbi:MAG: glutaredoxin family protein [Candidatus Uhrbacteria bacterium]|nr:glutaredoxin family protein [Candidatus Uhrbacteria bacterium]